MSPIRKSKPIRKFLAAPLAVVGLALVPVGAQAAASFYVPPSPLPAGPPGTIIRAEPISYSGSATKPPRGTRIWNVLYKSTAADGHEIAVSGSVFTSGRYGTPAAKRPLIGFAPGSQGTGDTCAPSQHLAKGGVQDYLEINLLLGQGYNVAMTDYEGLGTPGTHTYAVNKSAAHSVIDVIRAARNLPAAGVSSQSPTFSFGYSQGGGASAATAELAPTYAPEITFKGFVAGGVIADPYAAGLSLNGGEYAGYLLAAALGYDAAYPELDLDKYLNQRGRVDRVRAEPMCFDDTLNTFKGTTIDLFTTSNPLEQPDWRARLDENALGKSAPQAPTYMWHGVNDQVLPYAATAKLRREWCEEGATLQFKAIRKTDHVMTAVFGLPDALAWIQNRLRGKPIANNCGSLARAPVDSY